MVVQVNDVGMELRAQDLRIGNYISINRQPVLVSNIDEDGINLNYECGCYGSLDKSFEGVFNHSDCLLRSSHLIYPIPLTEEILLKCGFEKLNNGFIIDDGSRNEHGDKIIGDKTFSIFDHSYGSCNKLKFNYTDFKYLHQIQNIYFVLTGQELNVKL